MKVLELVFLLLVSSETFPYTRHTYWTRI